MPAERGTNRPLPCTGETAAATNDPNTKTPQAQAIELMCRCDEIPDEGVELQILKGLLTATTSGTFTIHGQVRACGLWLGWVQARQGLRLGPFAAPPLEYVARQWSLTTTTTM